MDPNAKLRTLRAKLGQFVANNERCADLACECHSEREHRNRAEAFRRAVEEIDRLLAASEPDTEAGFGRFKHCKARLGECVAVTSSDGAYCSLGCFPAIGSHSWRNARGVLAPPRESSAEECARLFGHVGPDGKGRP